MTAEGCALTSKPGVLIFLIGLLLSPSAFSQIAPEPTNLSVISGVTIGYSPDKNKPLIEFPFVLNRNEFKFLLDTSGLMVGGAGVTVTIFDTMALAVDSGSVNLIFRANDSAQTERTDIRLCGTIERLISPGRYTARMDVIDMVSKKTGERFYRSVVVPTWDSNTFAIGRALAAWKIDEVGDDELADYDVRGNFRNGFSVLANPYGIFGQHDTTIYVYAEVYGLGADSSEFSLRAILVDSLNHRRELVSSRQQKPGNTAIIATSFSMKDWPTSPQTLWLTAFDPGRGLSASTHIPVRRIQFKAPTMEEFSAAAYDADPYDTMSLDMRQSLSQYFLSPGQRKSLSNLSDSGKRTYLDEFWRAQDQEPGTKANETRREIITRFKFVNDKYSTSPSLRDGWKTDRGRIFLTYGPPEGTVRDDFPEVEWQYEVWYYYSQRKSPVFVFQDTRNTNDYRLAHSNVDGEIYSATWATRLSRREGNRSEDINR